MTLNRMAHENASCGTQNLPFHTVCKHSGYHHTARIKNDAYNECRCDGTLRSQCD